MWNGFNRERYRTVMKYRRSTCTTGLAIATNSRFISLSRTLAAFLQVFLMIALCNPKLASWCDLRHNLPVIALLPLLPVEEEKEKSHQTQRKQGQLQGNDTYYTYTC